MHCSFPFPHHTPSLRCCLQAVSVTHAAKILVDTVPALRTECNCACWPAHRPRKRRKERTSIPHPVWRKGVLPGLLAVDCLVGIVCPFVRKLFSRREGERQLSGRRSHFIIYHFCTGERVRHCMHKQSRCGARQPKSNGNWATKLSS